MIISHYYQKSCANKRANKGQLALSIKLLIGNNFVLLLKPTSEVEK